MKVKITRNRQDIERDIGKELRLTPKGFNIYQQPYFDFTSKGMEKVLEKIRELKRK